MVLEGVAGLQTSSPFVWQVVFLNQNGVVSPDAPSFYLDWKKFFQRVALWLALVFCKQAFSRFFDSVKFRPS